MKPTTDWKPAPGATHRDWSQIWTSHIETWFDELIVKLFAFDWTRRAGKKWKH